ncbi:DUF799 domain-containing protein [Aquincola tertiaricarbonis]|uniref:DUF799 domain-containing protein n=1 Tax=Aquincola tertiaricarbonis TaxID=391953 RepID=A0ABY4SES9_AQUTE|nr:DUF799 domain-containing protein [Aquincola tertiaricarbonis]URI11827.1 DUF799 domain-containing protein [Aquincola tertiaricarbonis]
MKKTFSRLGRAGALSLICAAALLGGCATPRQPYDYTAFKQAKPASLLVLPPLNQSPEVKGGIGVWSQATLPLAEAGYYVMPVSLVEETFRENGLTTAADIHALDRAKLRDVFGADAAVYITVQQYGTSYAVVSSNTVVAVEGRIVDLRTGELLWQGKAMASSAEQQQSNQAGLIGLLVQAVVSQIIASSTDAGYRYAGIASQRLLSGGVFNGVLYGPRSPNYGKP